MQLGTDLDHRNTMHIYDYLIIGSGLTGLTIAKKLSQETENILVLEALDFSGGENRVAKLNEIQINNGLRFFPATEASKKSIDFLQDLLQTELTAEAQESNPETYEASGFKKFVGFGEKNVEFYDQLAYFLAHEEYALILQPFEWIQLLQESLKEKIQTRAVVTRFGFEATETEKPELTHVVVNGTKQLYAKNFIFTGPVKDLSLLLHDDLLNLRAKSKLKKAQAWQAICVDIFHSATVDKTNIFLLNGTTDDELGPCVGRFLPAVTSGQISQWVSFVDTEAAEDTENIGLMLKKMKRQIKRAFPDVADSIMKERIFVSTALSGADIKLTGHLTIPKVPNLWIASPQVSNSKNLLGSLQQAQLVLAAMGFDTGVQMTEHATAEDATEPAHEAEM